VNRGLATTDKVEVEVPTVVKRKVNIYTITEKGIDFKESE
jgi:DNA-binding PadR family transcriptional regulator